MDLQLTLIGITLGVIVILLSIIVDKLGKIIEVLKEK